jgi:hypothetical protein
MPKQAREIPLLHEEVKFLFDHVVNVDEHICTHPKRHAIVSLGIHLR